MTARFAPRSAEAALIAFALAACGSDPSVASSDAGAALDAAMIDAAAITDAGKIKVDDAGEDAAPVDTPWSSVSFGVTEKDLGTGTAIVIAYGGYTATDAESQAWVTELTTTRLAALGVSHLYAVRGPKDADYASREIGNSTLAAALGARSTANSLIVVAHSSGGFVADELFSFASASVLAKVTYFNLDGGSWYLTSAVVASMKGVYVCGAHDPVAGNSENSSSDASLHASLAGSRLFTVDASGSGCNVGAGWCLHDTLIIDHPHDPANYDLALDYTDFTGGRAIVSSYIDRAVSDGAL